MAIAILLLLLVLPAPIGLAVLGLALVGELGEVIFWRRFLRRYKIQSGAEAMVGKTAVVNEPCRPAGSVRFDGGVWHARCAAGAGTGEEVRITELDGLTLVVEPVTAP